jgi:hypothetical protein
MVFIKGNAKDSSSVLLVFSWCSPNCDVAFKIINDYFSASIHLPLSHLTKLHVTDRWYTKILTRGISATS